MKPRRHQSGYALLAVFMMSAAVALMLYQQLPRVAFESMRAKEEMLIERGEQYQRAIQLYVAQVKRYPQNMDDLEKTSGRRFLRRRYKDPFTGKDDWRLINVDAMGALTNSKVQKKDEKKPNQNSFVSEFAGLGQTQSTGTAGVNVALRRRPSDSAVEGGGGPGALPLPSSQEPMSQADAFALFQKQQEALLKQQQAQQNAQQQPVPPGAIPNPMVPGGAPGQPGQPGQPGMPAQPGQPVPIGPDGRPVNVQMGQVPGQISGQLTMQQAYPNGIPQAPGGFGPNQQGTFPTNTQMQPGRGPMGAPSGAPGAAPNAALDMIRQALTSPSPNIPMNMAPGLQLGPGIAGVASKYEAPSIKVYNEQQEYDRWEFIYDPRKDKRTQRQLAQMGVPGGGMAPGQQGQIGMNSQGIGLNQGGIPPNQQGIGMGIGGGQPGIGMGQPGIGGPPPGYGPPGASQGGYPPPGVPFPPGGPRPPNVGTPPPQTGGYPSPPGIGQPRR